MRMSKLFGRTLREAPADAEGVGYRLLTRAALVRGATGGRFTYLPLGYRSLENLEAQLRQGLEGHTGRNLPLPTGFLRWSALTDTASLAVVSNALAASDIQSYRQLPANLFATGPLCAGGTGRRGGPLNAAAAPGAFICTLSGDEAGDALTYAETQRAFVDLFMRCGLPVIPARDSLAPAIGHAYLFPTQDGDNAALLCDVCGYAALADIAAFSRPPAEAEALLPLERVATPHTATIADLAQLLDVPESRTAKAVLLMAIINGEERFAFVVVRGDMDVSERKVCVALRASAVRPATEAEIRAAGATPGYASPIGLKNQLIVVDESIPRSPNLVSGANEEGFHLLNTNYGRDYVASMVADVAAAQPGNGCPTCSSARLRDVAVAVIGRSSRLAPDGVKGVSSYLDATGRMQPVRISVHQLDLGCLLTAVAEYHHDEYGLRLPPLVAPYQVHLVGMPGAEAEAEALVGTLEAGGITCLYDDRGESAGVKFADADLIGMPLRLTLGKRSLQAGGAEFKRRDQAEKIIVPLDGALQAARDALASFETDMIARTEDLPYGEHLR